MQQDRHSVKHASLKEVIIRHAPALCGSRGSPAEERPAASSLHHRRGRKTGTQGSERTPATTGREGKLNSLTVEKEKIQSEHGYTTRLFCFWHECVCVNTSRWVFLWVRCDVVGTVAPPCWFRLFLFMYPQHPDPPPPSHFTEQPKHRGNQKQTLCLVFAYSRIPVLAKSHLWEVCEYSQSTLPSPPPSSHPPLRDSAQGESGPPAEWRIKASRASALPLSSVWAVRWCPQEPSPTITWRGEKNKKKKRHIQFPTRWRINTVQCGPEKHHSGSDNWLGTKCIIVNQWAGCVIISRDLNLARSRNVAQSVLLWVGGVVNGHGPE